MPFLFHIPSEAAGECLGASRVYKEGLCQSGQNCRSITVHGYKGPLDYADPYTARAIKDIGRKYIWHHIIRVGNRYVDWTARQFDSRTPYPLVMSLTKLRTFWQHVKDTTKQKDMADKKAVK